MTHRLALHTLCFCIMATTTALAHAGKSDLHPLREPPRDSSHAKAQEAAKQKLVAKIRSEAPLLTHGQATDLASALDAPIFHRYDQP